MLVYSAKITPLDGEEKLNSGMVVVMPKPRLIFQNRNFHIDKSQ